MSALPNFTKRLESRIALALAKAESALASIASLQNHSATTNAAPVGPAGTVALAAPSFTPRTGKVRILAYATVSGGTAVAGDTILGFLFRDGVQLPGAPITTEVLLAGGLGSVVLLWDDTVTANTAHVWSISLNISNGSGHTITIPIGGGSGGGLAGIILQELP